jgi:hypothetical protein
MTCLQQIRAGKHTAGEYASREDICRVFAENLNSLYQLSLLLTGDDEKAEQCFVASLGDSIKANNVFKKLARHWAKRTIIENAIRALRPHPGAANSPIPVAPQERSVMDNLLALGNFERFVFVMCVLERYSEQGCSALLSCSVEDIRRAGTKAFKQLTELSRTSHFDERVRKGGKK